MPWICSRYIHTQANGIFSLKSIVAVHGLNGDAFKTWTTDKGKVNWLKDPNLLPKYVPSARVLTWGYNANVVSLKGKNTSSSDRILQHAQTLVAQLQADREVWVFSFFIPTSRLVVMQSRRHWTETETDNHIS